MLGFFVTAYEFKPTSRPSHRVAIWCPCRTAPLTRHISRARVSRVKGSVDVWVWVPEGSVSRPYPGMCLRFSCQWGHLVRVCSPMTDSAPPAVISGRSLCACADELSTAFAPCPYLKTCDPLPGPSTENLRTEQ
jgi:hypothetical protein